MSLNDLFLGFSALCDFFTKYFFGKKYFFPNISNSCSLNIFEPKIWRRLGTFPSCFFFFFRQTTDLIVYVLFSTEFTRFTVNPAVTGSSPCFSQKLFRAFVKADETEGSPLSILFGTVRLFSIFLPSKGPTFKFFLIFCSKLKC